jgi:hypothetical protein
MIVSRAGMGMPVAVAVIVRMGIIVMVIVMVMVVGGGDIVHRRMGLVGTSAGGAHLRRPPLR